MRKTLLLVFIHGFKGGDDTFGSFPEHLRALISHALPKIDVISVTYPRFETRGDLKECVAKFREWLQNKVIDLEVANSTPSPTIDPSVHVVLCGHSMGGIVGAETIHLLASEQLIPPSSSVSDNNFPSNTTQSSTTGTSHPNLSNSSSTEPNEPSTFMFPHITALVAFDTPFLGISPGVVAHGAESHYKTASNAYKTFSEVSSIFGWGSQSGSSSASKASSNATRALPAPSTGDAAATPSWQSWGKYAMFAGAAGAVAAGASAAIYSQRENLSWGWSWVTSHLEFVGCLARGEEMKQRVSKLGDVQKTRGLASIDFYTVLGKSASEGIGASQTVLGDRRTFCSLPKRVHDSPPPSSIEATLTASSPAKTSAHPGLTWHPALNDKADNEIVAHMSMFEPKNNPHFYTLGSDAKDWIVNHLIHGHRDERSWYEESAMTASPERDRSMREFRLRNRDDEREEDATADDLEDSVVVDRPS